MKKLLFFTMLIISCGVLHAANGGPKWVDSIGFTRDGTTQTTAASGSGGGSNLYPTTGTPNIQFGFSASTGVFTSTLSLNSYLSVSTHAVGPNTIPSIFSPNNIQIGINFTNGSAIQFWQQSGAVNYTAMTITQTELDITTQTVISGKLGVSNTNPMTSANLKNDFMVGGTVGVYYTAASTPSCTCGTGCVVYGTDYVGIVVFGSPVSATCKVTFHDVHFSTPSCHWTYHSTSTLPWYSVDTKLDSTFTVQGPDTLNGSFVSYDCEDVRYSVAGPP